MYDPEKNTIGVSKAPTKDQLARDSASWFLHTLVKLQAEGKGTPEIDEKLDRIVDWSGVDRAKKLLDENGRATPEYNKLLEMFSSTFVAWLVEGKELPKAARPLASIIQEQYTSADEVSGAKFSDEIRDVFLDMFDDNAQADVQKTSSKQGADASNSTVRKGREEAPKQKKRRTSRLKALLGCLFRFRTDLMGRIRVVLSPAVMLVVTSILDDDNWMSGPLDLPGFVELIADSFDSSDDGGFIVLPILLLLGWTISGAVEGLVRWVAFGNAPPQ